jgi:hypothetical protein
MDRQAAWPPNRIVTPTVARQKSNSEVECGLVCRDVCKARSTLET